MGRVAIFVDAGYFYARTADALTGRSQGRRAIDVDEQTVVDQLILFALEKCRPDTLLRVYWYDGAAGGGLSPDQIRIAEVDEVKVRLGVINTYGQQKGVDSLIVIDLIDLARNRAIDSVVLMSGDEDIRVAVSVAQTYGVRVHLLGIQTSGGTAQSRALVREADTVSTWDAETLRRFAKTREDEPLVISVAEPVKTQADKDPVADTGELPNSAPAASLAAPDETSIDPPEDSDAAYAAINTAVATFLSSLTTADRDDILLVFDRQKTLPISHDRRLLGSVRKIIGRQLSVNERRTMRTTAIALLRAASGSG